MVITYFLRALPYMAITVSIYLYIRFSAWMDHRARPNFVRETVLLLLVLYLTVLLSQTILPRIYIYPHKGFRVSLGDNHTTNLIPFYAVVRIIRAFLSGEDGGRLLFFFFGNILMFVPFGIFFRLLWRFTEKAVLLFGCTTSFLIELTQLFLSRETDIDDFLLNVLGTVLGLFLFRLLERKRPEVIARCRRKGEKY